MNLAACLSIFSSFSMSFWGCGSQTTEPYSNDERIKVRYAVFLQLSGQCFKFLRSIAYTSLIKFLCIFSSLNHESGIWFQL